MKLHPISLSDDPLETLARDFAGLYSGKLGLSSIAGGQTAANAALAGLNIFGYAATRSQVLPRSRRGATVLSPYIRHNILTLPQVAKAVQAAPYRDREKFRDELFWQEYARHLYARLGVRLFHNLRFEANRVHPGEGWDRDMLCMDEVLTELESDGWVVNQTRMWLASQWTVRSDVGWLEGQERMYQQLIDGSRAANLLGWQWTVGAGTGRPYGFVRWQVEKRAPGLCAQCALQEACPIQEFPGEVPLAQRQREPLLDRDPNPGTTGGPLATIRYEQPELVQLTIESLGDADPALAAHPDLPAVFVFNQDALAMLQLSARRLGFYLQTLQDLSTRREVHAYLGDPFEFARNHRVAVTFAPVPSFHKMPRVAELHPYPWLTRPHSGSVRSYTSWRKSIRGAENSDFDPYKQLQLPINPY